MNQAGCKENCQHKKVSPSICTLCGHYLLVYDYDETCSLEELRPVVILKCGHLFHASCIIDDFKKPYQGNDPSLKSCPYQYCNRKTRMCEIMKLIPVSADEDVYRESNTPEQNVDHAGCRRVKYRPAPTTCTICYEYVVVYNNVATEDGGPSDATELRPMITLRCGHYFHTSCINNYWFGGSLQGNDRTLKPCPYCRREMKRWETRRIFPVLSRAGVSREE